MIEYRGQVALKEDERIDDLKRNGYGIIQRSGGFCFGMDAVLLSGFAAVKAGGIVVDLGTGTGVIPILLEAKTKGKEFYGVELQADVADMAERSVKLNALTDKVHIVCGDIRDIAGGGQGACSEPLGGEVSAEGACISEDDNSANAGDIDNAENVHSMAAAGTEADRPSRSVSVIKPLCGRVDTVTSNPPYMKLGDGLTNPDDTKLISRHEVCCTLNDVCRAAAKLLKQGGHFYMVHRPLRLAEIVTELRAAGLEPKRIKPVYPYIDREANMILIDAVKGGAEECRMEKPLIIYKEKNVYSDEIYDIYGY